MNTNRPFLRDRYDFLWLNQGLFDHSNRMSLTLLCNMCCRNYAYSVICSDVHDFMFNLNDFHALLQFSQQLLELMLSGIAFCWDEFTSASLDQHELCFDMVLCYFVLDQVVAVGYAIMTTRSPDLSWQMRAVRVLPMFLVPALAALIYSTITRLTKMRKYTLIFVYMLWCRPHVCTS